MEQAVWMKVTTDKFRLPLIVADTAAELASWRELGRQLSLMQSITVAICHPMYG